MGRYRRTDATLPSPGRLATVTRSPSIEHHRVEIELEQSLQTGCFV